MDTTYVVSPLGCLDILNKKRGHLAPFLYGIRMLIAEDIALKIPSSFLMTITSPLFACLFVVRLKSDASK